MNEHMTMERKFVLYLESLVPDRGAMANLRRGLGKPPSVAHEMDGYIIPHLPYKSNQWQEQYYYLVASLFAYWHQGQGKALSLNGHTKLDRNLGRSLRNLAAAYTRAGTTREEANKRIEKRLAALLDANTEDLPRYLRQIISLLKSQDIPVNWEQLLRDIQYWSHDDRFIQHEWAQGFWISGGDETNREHLEPQDE